MTNELTPRQQILLWDLVSRGGCALQKELKPDVGPADREPLRKAKLISITKTKNNALLLTIEESGWDHLASHSPSLLKSGQGTKYDRPILQFVLSRVQRYAVENSLAIAALFSTSSASKTKESPKVEPQIVEAFFALAGPARNHVHLSALRARLPHIARPELDAALLEMRREGRVNLMNLDNPRDIEKEKDAALQGGNQTFHILWIES